MFQTTAQQEEIQYICWMHSQFLKIFKIGLLALNTVALSFTIYHTEQKLHRRYHCARLSKPTGSQMQGRKMWVDEQTYRSTDSTTPEIPHSPLNRITGSRLAAVWMHAWRRNGGRQVANTAAGLSVGWASRSTWRQVDGQADVLTG